MKSKMGYQETVGWRVGMKFFSIAKYGEDAKKEAQNFSRECKRRTRIQNMDNAGRGIKLADPSKFNIQIEYDFKEFGGII